MVVEISNVPADLPDLIISLGNVVLFLQAVGVVILFFIIAEIATLYFNRKRRKLLEEMSSYIKRIEKKIDKLNKK